MDERTRKLTQLDQVNSVANTDLLYLVSNGVSYAVTAEVLFRAFEAWEAASNTP